MTLFSLPSSLLLLSFSLLTSTLVIPSTASTPNTKDCTSLIQRSLSPTFDWTSPSALSLANCLLTTPPSPNTCVFYTSSARDDAIRYALTTHRTTIYDVYPPSYFDISIYPASAWLESGHLRDLFKITSKAYAISCSGEASLVLKEGGEVCKGSIWVTDEYDAIKNGLSRIVEPVMRVEWVRDSVSGLWGWVVDVLEKAGLKEKEREDLKRRGLMVSQKVVEVGEAVGGEVERKMKELGKKWKWNEMNEDGWAVLEGCRR